MQVSIDLTLTPLQDDYEQHIINFIKVLRNSKFSVLENPLSTQIFGNYSELMSFLNQAIEHCFENLDMVVLNMKLVKTNRSSYEPHF